MKVGFSEVWVVGVEEEEEEEVTVFLGGAGDVFIVGVEHSGTLDTLGDDTLVMLEVEVEVEVEEEVVVIAWGVVEVVLVVAVIAFVLR